MSKPRWLHNEGVVRLILNSLETRKNTKSDHERKNSMVNARKSGLERTKSHMNARKFDLEHRNSLMNAQRSDYGRTNSLMGALKSGERTKFWT